MQFIVKGTKFIAVRTTGPNHNFLALEFEKGGKSGKIGLKDVGKIQGSTNRPKISAAGILRQVEGGVEDANRKLKKDYRIKTIEYVSTDTPPIEVYRELAEYIVRQLER